MDPFDTLTADMPHTLPVPPGYKLDWLFVASSADFAPDGQTRTFEPGRWTRVTFVHSGTSLWLYLDGVLAGVRHDVISPVLPVREQGSTSAAPRSLRRHAARPARRAAHLEVRPPPLHEAVLLPADEPRHRGVLAARPRAPRSARRRPRDPRADAGRPRLRESGADRPDARGGPGGQPALDQVRRLGRRYDELWCRGVINGPAMQALTREFTSWLGQAAGDASATYRRRVARRASSS